MSRKHSKTMISRNFRSTVLRFCNIKTILVRQFYVFATLMSGKQSKTSIYKMKTREALTFLTVRKLKTREALTFSLVFTVATTRGRAGAATASIKSRKTAYPPKSLRLALTHSFASHARTKRFPGCLTLRASDTSSKKQA